MSIVTPIGFAITILCFVGMLFCTLSTEWKVISPLDTQDSLQRLQYSEGLWLRCNEPVPGNIQCDNYGTTLFDVEPHLQVLRALMILGVISILMSSFSGCFAMDCIHVVKGRSKRMLGIVAAILAILAGAMCGGAVSWYAGQIVWEFRYPTHNEQPIKYTFGAALYVGWVTAGFAVLAGILLFCGSCSNDDVDDRDVYTYKPPKNKTSEEYV